MWRKEWYGNVRGGTDVQRLCRDEAGEDVPAVLHPELGRDRKCGDGPLIAALNAGRLPSRLLEADVGHVRRQEVRVGGSVGAHGRLVGPGVNQSVWSLVGTGVPKSCQVG